MRLLFLHGAGGYEEDLTLARVLGEQLGAELLYPRLPDTDFSVEAWTGPIRAALAELTADDRVVAHSLGATMLLHVLAEGGSGPRRATLLAMPDWGPDGWDVPGYVPPTLPETVALTLNHCRDDEIVPLDHLALNVARLPGAKVVIHETGGHQLEGLEAVIVSH